MIRVLLPVHLRRPANVDREVELAVAEPVCMAAVLDALEARYPMLRGTIRDQITLQRRPFIRYFACGEDWSLDPTDKALPAPIVTGSEALRIVGAMSGG